MSARSCPHEQEVLAALRRDSWSESLRAHVAACPVCSEVAFVGIFLLDEARGAEVEAPLPDPGRIWLEARMRSYRLKVARATRPITVVQRVAGVCAAAVAIAVAAQLEPHLGRWLAWLRPPSTGLASGLSYLHGVLLLVASAGFLIVAGYTLFSAWRES